MINRHRMLSIAALGLMAAHVPKDQNEEDVQIKLADDVEPAHLRHTRAEPQNRMPHQGNKERARRLAQLNKSK